MDVEDTGTGAASAMRAAVQRRPHVVFGPYGSNQTVAALAATQRVVWNHGGATSRLRKPQCDRAINVLSPASSYCQGALEAIRAAAGAARTVALVHRNTGFGRFRLDPVSGLQVGHQVLTVQWQDGQRSVVWPPEAAQRPLRYPLPAP